MKLIINWILKFRLYFMLTTTTKTSNEQEKGICLISYLKQGQLKKKKHSLGYDKEIQAKELFTEALVIQCNKKQATFQNPSKYKSKPTK